jgi:glyoxylase-like metal-dependent hydrolase (beta-lactamase superfamily II)
MLRWTVGDVEIVRVDGANFTLPSDELMPAWAVPAFTPSVHEAPVAFSALALRSGDTRIVVDPWLVDDSPRRRADAGNVVDGLLAALASVGFAADEVDLVVNSHIDGIGWNTRPSDGRWVPTFPNATYLFPADELAAVDAGLEVIGSEHLTPLYEAGVVHPVPLPHTIDGSITLEPAPGHNWGHLAVRIDAGGEVAIYPGHLVLSLLQVDQPDRDLGDTDLAVAITSRRRLLGELADRHGILLTTLVGGAGGGAVERNGDGYRLVAEPPDPTTES